MTKKKQCKVMLFYAWVVTRKQEKKNVLMLIYYRPFAQTREVRRHVHPEDGNPKADFDHPSRG